MCRCMLAMKLCERSCNLRNESKNRTVSDNLKDLAIRLHLSKPNSQHHPPRLQIINFISQHVPFLIQQTLVNVLVVNIFIPYMLKFAIGVKTIFYAGSLCFGFYSFNILQSPFCSKYAR